MLCQIPPAIAKRLRKMGSVSVRTMYRLDSSHPVIRLVLVARRRLDCDALVALFHAHSHFRVLCGTTEIKIASEIVRHRRPDLVVMDGGLIDEGVDDSFDQIAEQLGRTPVLVLDEEIKNGRLAAILRAPGAGYFTRHAPFEELAKGIDSLVRGQRRFCLRVMERIQQSPQGWSLRADRNVTPVATLTPREIEVLKLIALGHSIKHCAEVLALAPSTVDNHKSRLMKKLGIHKSLDLTRLAIREGLVSV